MTERTSAKGNENLGRRASPRYVTAAAKIAGVKGKCDVSESGT
jgi:hypothetical protein